MFMNIPRTLDARSGDQSISRLHLEAETTLLIVNEELIIKYYMFYCLRPWWCPARSTAPSTLRFTTFVLFFGVAADQAVAFSTLVLVYLIYPLISVFCRHHAVNMLRLIDHDYNCVSRGLHGAFVVNAYETQLEFKLSFRAPSRPSMICAEVPTLVSWSSVFA